MDPLLPSPCAFLALIGTAVGSPYLAATSAPGKRSIAFLSGIIMMSFAHYAVNALSGAEPKVLMILSGLITVYAFQRKLWGVCGRGGGLAAPSWQPGVLFAGVPFLLVLGRRERSTHRGPLGIAVGACVPVAGLALYLVRHGAFVQAV